MKGCDKLNIQVRDDFNVQKDLESKKKSLIDNIYREILLEKETPSVDDITDIYIASKDSNANVADIRSYIISYMLECKNYCFMFGNKSCDCQEILIKELLEDECMLLGE